MTQESYQALLGRNPAKFTGPRRPVDRVSWLSAILYCNMPLARRASAPCYDPQTQRCDFAAAGYRLPTEAEWEYACRAGSTAPWPFGSTAADFPITAGSRTMRPRPRTPCGEKLPNAWGLYDMLGNVAEWCNDYYAEQYRRQPAQIRRAPRRATRRVLRGGSWNARTDACRPAARKARRRAWPTRASATRPMASAACGGRNRNRFKCGDSSPLFWSKPRTEESGDESPQSEASAIIQGASCTAHEVASSCFSC